MTRTDLLTEYILSVLFKQTMDLTDFPSRHDTMSRLYTNNDAVVHDHTEIFE